MTKKLDKNLTYQELIEMMELRPIILESDYKKAVKIMDLLSVKDNLNCDEEDYLVVLSYLMGKYEKVHFPIEKNDPIEILKYILEENNLTSLDLDNLLGKKGLGDKILTKKCDLCKRNIKILAKRFCVAEELFWKCSS